MATCARPNVPDRLGIALVVPLLLSAFALRAGEAQALPYSDLQGDALTGAFQNYDITSIDAVHSSTHLAFTVQLVGTPTAPSVNQNQGLSGFIDIDIDLNPNTGVVATIDTIGGTFGNTGLGIEYYLDLFSEATNPGFVALRDPVNVLNVSQVPITYGNNSFTIVVPLSALGNDDGLVNYAVAVGDFAFAQDQALDASVVGMGGQPAVSSPVLVPEPGSGMLLGLGLGWLANRRRTAFAAV